VNFLNNRNRAGVALLVLRVTVFLVMLISDRQVPRPSVNRKKALFVAGAVDECD
jgi:hypothetical protein